MTIDKWVPYMIFIISVRYNIRVYQHTNGKAPFTDWVGDLDKAIRARINARIARFEDGHFGDHKSLGDGVLEARFFFGPGYRVYFAICNDQLILLLMGGDKSTQSADVNSAKEFLKSFLEVKSANKKS